MIQFIEFVDRYIWLIEWMDGFASKQIITTCLKLVYAKIVQSQIGAGVNNSSKPLPVIRSYKLEWGGVYFDLPLKQFAQWTQIWKTGPCFSVPTWLFDWIDGHGKLIKWTDMIDWLDCYASVDRSIDWSIYWLIDLLIGWLVSWRGREHSAQQTPVSTT